MRFADPEFQQSLRDALNADEEFALESRWFDGSIVLESGADRCWLKIYRGQIIDHLEFIPPFGYSFKLAVTLPLAVLGIEWALLMGLLCGLLPALRGARQDPSRALRYE